MFSKLKDGKIDKNVTDNAKPILKTVLINGEYRPSLFLIDANRETTCDPATTEAIKNLFAEENKKCPCLISSVYDNHCKKSGIPCNGEILTCRILFGIHDDEFKPAEFPKAEAK